MSYLTGNKDIDIKILLELSYEDIIRTCRTNKYAYTLYKNDILWKKKLFNDFKVDGTLFYTYKEMYDFVYLGISEKSPDIIDKVANTYLDIYGLNEIKENIDARLAVLQTKIQETIDFILDPVLGITTGSGWSREDEIDIFKASYSKGEYEIAFKSKAINFLLYIDGSIRLNTTVEYKNINQFYKLLQERNYTENKSF